MLEGREEKSVIRMEREERRGVLEGWEEKNVIRKRREEC